MSLNANIRMMAAGPSNKARLLVLPLALAGVGLIGLIMLRLQAQDATLPLVMMCALCLGALVVIRPEIGLGAIVICAAVVKITIGTGTDSVIVTSLLSAVVLLAGWLAHQILHKKKVNLLPPWIAAFAVALLGFVLFSWIWGRLTLDPRVFIPPNFYRVQMAQTAIIIISISLLFIGADLFRSRRARSALMAALIVVGFMALPFRAFVLEFDTLNTAGLFGIWFVSLCWANAVLNTRLPDAVRVLLGAGAFSWILMALLREGAWVSGWLPVLVALLFVSIMAGPRVAVPVILIGLVVIAVSFSFFHELLITTQVADGSLGGEFGRLELWKRNLIFSQDRLTLGAGPAGYALYYMTFLPDQAMSTHNNYVDLLAQTGIAGVGSFIALLLGLFYFGVRTWSKLTDPVDRVLCATVVGALPALMFSMWFGDWLIPFVYNLTIVGFNHSVYSWLMLAALCGLIAQTRQQENSSA